MTNRVNNKTNMFLSVKYRFTLMTWLLIGLTVISIVGCKGSVASIKSMAKTQQSEKETMKRIELPVFRSRAPEFPKEFGWVNTDKQLTINGDLKGNIVILDFWTYCCINCMHVLPDLEYIEKKYAGKPVVIIGVHSAKFDNEGDDENIQQACHRYNIAHPVIVDQQHRIWSEYAVNSWPTLVVVDPPRKSGRFAFRRG